jgi:ubiquinone/menaquinone biosynthesis C-methylase UbiE
MESKGGRGGFFPKKQASRRPVRKVEEKGWDGVAGWYDKLVGADGSDYHRNVILPATMDLLAVKEGDAVLDLCCGQGVLVRHLLSAGAGHVLGVDASGKLIGAARQRYGGEKNATFLRADACAPGAWADGTFDAAACVMAVHDVPDADGLMGNLSTALKPGGRLVIVMMHPCFRIPKESHWGWDTDQKVQYRRLDRYGKSLEIGIQTRPGLGTDEGTVFYHRPLADIITAMGKAGLGVTKCTELFSHRRSQVGPFSKAEHRAAEEFPLFLGLAAVKM